MIRSAGDDNYIYAFIGEGLDNPNRTIEEKACTYFRRYPLVYAEQSMHRAEQKLVAADTLCRQATEDASGDAVLVRECDQARQQAGQLATSARDFGRDIRMHPRYRTEVADEGREQIAQRHAEAAERTARAAEIRALTPRVTVVNNIASNRNTYGENGIRSKQ